MATGQWGGAFNQRVFRANVLFTHGGQRCMTGFHLRDVGINTLDPEDVANEVAEWATTQFVKLLHTNDRVTGIDAENLVSKEGFSVSPNNVAGLAGNNEVPAGLTVPVSLKGSIRRRYGSGRMLWPISDNNRFTGQTLNAAAVTTYAEVTQDLIDRFVGPAITTSMHLVHLHGDLPQTASRPAVPATWYDITSIRVNTTVSFLRRRKAGVGL